MIAYDIQTIIKLWVFVFNNCPYEILETVSDKKTKLLLHKDIWPFDFVNRHFWFSPEVSKESDQLNKVGFSLLF